MASKVRQITIPVAFRTNTKALDTAAGRFAAFGAGVAAVAAASVIAIGKIGIEATKMASEFEDSFAKIEGLVGVGKSQLGELEDAARRLGPQFGKSANEAADALFYITSAGLRGEAAVNVLEASLKGAAIGLGETKTIADLATSAVNAYGESQLNGAQAVDVLTEAVRLGKLEPDALAQVMGNVLPLASNLGVTFQEVGAAMAGMSKTGTDASTAATQLRGILTTIAKPTAQADEQLAKMGMSAAGLREQIREEGLYATLETLTTAFDGNIEATTQVFGNVRALSGVLDLMGASAEDNRILFEQMTDEVGVLDDALAVTSDTASFKLAKAMEKLQASMLPVGDMLLGIGAKALDSIMPVLERLAPTLERTFANLEEPLNTIVAELPRFLDALLPILPLMGDITALIMELVAAALPPFSALLELLIPILQTLMDTMGPFLSEVFSQLSPLLTEAIELLMPLIQQILPIFITLWDTLAPIVLEFIDAFLPIIRELLPLLTMNLELVVLPVLQMFAEMLSVTLPAAFQLLQQLGFLPNLDAMSSWSGGISQVVSSVRTFIAESMNSVIASLEGATNSAIDMVNNLLNAGRRLPGKAGELFKKVDPLSHVSFGRVELPGKYDYLTFPEVDTTGVSDVAGRAAGLYGRTVQTYSSAYEDAMTKAMLSRAGANPLAGTRGFYTDAQGNSIFGTIPAFASGGIVTGPTLGLVGEAGPEAIVPLSKADRFGATYNITVNAGIGTDGARVGEQIVKAIKKYERQSGPVFAGA